MKPNKYSYCIFYIEKKYIHTIQSQLDYYGYDHIKVIIPKVKILKKTHKGKNIYEEEPVLFNYGFIRMRTKDAYSRDFMNTLRKRIQGIRKWLQSNETLHPKKKRKRIDNIDIWDDFSKVATCSRSDVKRFIDISKENKKFAVEDLYSIKPGDYVVLKGYPFNGVDATILQVDYTKNRAKLLLYPQNGRMEVWVDFDNILYNAYQNYDADKLTVNSKDYDTRGITEDNINDVYNLRQV